MQAPQHPAWWGAGHAVTTTSGGHLNQNVLPVLTVCGQVCHGPQTCQDCRRQLTASQLGPQAAVDPLPLGGAGQGAPSLRVVQDRELCLVFLSPRTSSVKWAAAHPRRGCPQTRDRPTLHTEYVRPWAPAPLSLLHDHSPSWTAGQWWGHPNHPHPWGPGASFSTREPHTVSVVTAHN